MPAIGLPGKILLGYPDFMVLEPQRLYQIAAARRYPSFWTAPHTLNAVEQRLGRTGGLWRQFRAGFSQLKTRVAARRRITSCPARSCTDSRGKKYLPKHAQICHFLIVPDMNLALARTVIGGCETPVTERVKAAPGSRENTIGATLQLVVQWACPAPRE